MGLPGLLARCFSRRVVGWHVSESLHTDLILTAFNRAVAICQPPPGLLVHADQGSQYTRDAFTTLLDRTQAIASLSRPGNPYDNALAKNGWSTLKTELLPRGACFADLQEARFERPSTSTITTTPGAYTRPWATAPRSKLNSPTVSTYLNLVSTGTRPDHLTVKIAVEVKNSREESSPVNEFHKSIGQVLNYMDILSRKEPSRTVYLAVSRQAYATVFSNSFVKIFISILIIKILVFNPITETITKWDA